MASYEDSAAGWLIYRDHAGQISLEELNEVLQATGFKPIAPRSMQHYRKLQRNGYQEYISINRLDLRHASDSIFDITDRSRYEERPAEIHATLFLPTAKRPEVLIVKGKLTRVSEGFAAFVISKPSHRVIQATKSPKFNKGALRFDKTGYERAVQVAEAMEYEGEVEVLLTFRSLLSADILFPDRVGPTSRSRLTIELPPQPTMHEVVVSIHRTFDLLESLRGMIDALLSDLPEDQRPVLPTPRVDHLTAGSPLIQELIGSPWVILIAVPLIKLVLTFMKDATSVAATIKSIQTQENQEKRAEDRHMIEVQALQLDNLKKEIDVRTVLRPLEHELWEMYEVALDEIATVKGKRVEAFKNQAIEAVVELGVGTELINLDAQDDSPTDSSGNT